MHNIHVQPPGNCEDTKNEWEKPKLCAEADDSDTELEQPFVQEAARKSFEDEDESSIRSDDLSRSEALSDDTFQTPSTSMQNLLIISPAQPNEIEEVEIKQDINSGNISPIIEDDEEKEVPSKLPSRQVSLVTESEGKGESCPLTNIQSVPADLPATSNILSPNIVSGNSDLTLSTESNISRESNSSSSGNNSGNAGNKEFVSLQPGTYNSKPSKKKMWYHVFTTSYKTRSTDFRKYFKDLPTEERLIVDYSCALQKEILVQGRMFISQSYVSFYANIFGWQTLITIKLKEISGITKEQTAIVIPNAIQVVSGNEKYFFTSFVNRDSTFIMLFKLWQTALLDQNMSQKEIWKLVHACYGEVEIGSEEESTEDYMSLSSSRSLVNPSASTRTSSNGNENKSNDVRRGCSAESVLSDLLGPTVLTSAGIVNAAEIVNTAGNLANGVINVDMIPTDLSDSSDSEEEHIPEDLSSVIPICTASHDDGKIVMDALIQCDVDTLFTMLFTNSKFYMDFHTTRKTFDIVQHEWQEKDGRTTRDVSFTVTLNHMMGPKHSQITETQLLLPVSKPGYFYAVDIESINSGIPYEDAFYVTCHFCLSRVAPRQSRLIIVAQLRFKKSIWGFAKTIIEKNSWIGLDEFYSSLEKSLKGECANLALASPPPSPRGKSVTIRRRPLRKKGPAPGIPVVGTPVSVTPNINMPVAAIGVVTDGIGISADPLPSMESSVILKVILSVLACLLLLNAFLYIKLSRLENSAGIPILFSTTPVTFMKEMPKTHQEWLDLLQQQEALHRFELKKWHDVLLSALKILNQAEMDLESLKNHIDAYTHVKLHETLDNPGNVKTGEFIDPSQNYQATPDTNKEAKN